MSLVWGLTACPIFRHQIKKISGSYVYFSSNTNRKKQQTLSRKDTVDPLQLGELKPDVLMNELKAALIIFFSILNEKQRRLYAGLESMKMGRGGDRMIAELLEINVKTVTKGRKELLNDTLSIETIREGGGGRKRMEKKIQKISKDEDITVNNEDITKYVEPIAQQYKITTDEFINTYKKSHRFDLLKNQIESKKVLDFLHENVKIKKGKKITLKELFNK